MQSDKISKKFQKTSGASHVVISKWKKRENEPHMSHKQIKRSCGGLSEKSVRKKKWWTGELNPGPCGGAAF